MPAKNLREVREARKHGFSTVISVTGFCEIGKKYKIENMVIEGKNRVVLTEV